MDRETNILQSFRKGNLKPFYEQMYATLLLYASFYLDEESAFLSEDLVQSAILKAYEQHTRFTDFVSLKAFLYTCIRNDAVSIYRKHQARSNYVSECETIAESDNALIERETIRLLYAAVRSLPLPQQQVLKYAFFHGMKAQEIAQVMHISERSVKNYKAKALATLRQQLAEVEEDPDIRLFLLLLLSV